MEIFACFIWEFQFRSDLSMFGKDVFVTIVSLFPFKKVLCKKGHLQGHFFNFNKAVSWLFLFFSFLDNYFVDTLFTLWVLKCSSSWQPLSLPAPPGTRTGCPVCPPCGGQPWGGERGNLEPASIRVLHSPPTLCVQIVLSSVMVASSDGYNGEWLVAFFSFCFAFW